MSRCNTVEMRLGQILVLVFNYCHLKCSSVANLFNQPTKIEIKMAQHISWINQNDCMCNRKTKQWHKKPTLAEYKTMNVYCIVNELKTVSKWDKMMEVTTKVLTELTADLWLWSCEGMREGVSRWAGDPLPLEICHIWYWAVMDDLLKCSDVVGRALRTNRFNYETEIREKLEA